MRCTAGRPCERPRHVRGGGSGEGTRAVSTSPPDAPGLADSGEISNVVAGRRALAPPGGDVSTRPATPADGSRAAEGRSAGPRSALDADAERRGIRRLAETTAGPRTGAGSRPRRRRRGRSRAVSCPGEAGLRHVSADRVGAPARVAAGWCCRWCWWLRFVGLFFFLRLVLLVLAPPRC